MYRFVLGTDGNLMHGLNPISSVLSEKNMNLSYVKPLIIYPLYKHQTI